MRGEGTGGKQGEGKRGEGKGGECGEGRGEEDGCRPLSSLAFHLHTCDPGASGLFC